jgi:hypothetical protein
MTATLLILSAVGIMTCALVFLEQPNRNLLWIAVWNCGHTPLFGVFALFVLAVGSGIQTGGARRPSLYIAVFLMTAAVGLFTEIVQALAGGDAEFEDIGRDIAGAASFLAIAATCDRRHAFRGASGRWIIRAGSLLLAGITVIPVALLGRAYLARNAAFPTILDFRAGWSRQLLKLSDADITLNPPDPSGWSARITFHPAVFPGLTLEEPYPDWTRYNRLSFTIFSRLAEPVRIVLRIDDIHHNNNHGDRFNRNLEIIPGVNHISIPLSDIRRAPRKRQMDMTHIYRLLLFANRPASSFSLDFDTFRLE